MKMVARRAAADEDSKKPHRETVQDMDGFTVALGCVDGPESEPVSLTGKIVHRSNLQADAHGCRPRPR